MQECAICGSSDFEFLFKSNDYSGLCPQWFNVAKCLKCGMAGINPLPDIKCTYFAVEPYSISAKKDFWRFLNPNRARLIERFKKSGRIMDVGCGNGEFLYEMKRRGWDVFGNETSEERFNFAKRELGLKNILFGDLLSLDFPEKSFDVATLWHVIEHLEKPVEVLQKISRFLKDDGVLIIESPDFSSCQRRFFKNKWFALCIPYHIHFFCPECLAVILERANLKIFKKDYFANPRIDFIALKRSILRLLRLEIVPLEDGVNESFVLRGLKRCQLLYKFLRINFEVFCFLLSLSLALLNCGNTFRVYCRRKSV